MTDGEIAGNAGLTALEVTDTTSPSVVGLFITPPNWRKSSHIKPNNSNLKMDLKNSPFVHNGDFSLALSPEDAPGAASFIACQVWFCFINLTHCTMTVSSLVRLNSIFQHIASGLLFLTSHQVLSFSSSQLWRSTLYAYLAHCSSCVH